MEIHLAPDTETQLQHLAVSQGKNPAQLVEETVTRMLQRHAEFLEGVERGIAAADRGEFVESSECGLTSKRFCNPDVRALDGTRRARPLPNHSAHPAP